jgi:hypothetical protein
VKNGFAGVQPMPEQARSSIPVPKAGNPSGRPLPIERSMIRVWSKWRWSLPSTASP